MSDSDWKGAKNSKGLYVRDYISRLAWGRLGISQEELESVAGEKEAFGALLRRLPPRKRMDGWMDGLYVCRLCCHGFDLKKKKNRITARPKHSLSLYIRDNGTCWHQRRCPDCKTLPQRDHRSAATADCIGGLVNYMASEVHAVSRDPNTA